MIPLDLEKKGCSRTPFSQRPFSVITVLPEQSIYEDDRFDTLEEAIADAKRRAPHLQILHVEGFPPSVEHIAVIRSEDWGLLGRGCQYLFFAEAKFAALD